MEINNWLIVLVTLLVVWYLCLFIVGWGFSDLTEDVEEETDSTGAEDRRHRGVWERQEGARGFNHFYLYCLQQSILSLSILSLSINIDISQYCLYQSILYQWGGAELKQFLNKSFDRLIDPLTNKEKFVLLINQLVTVVMKLMMSVTWSCEEEKLCQTCLIFTYSTINNQ